MFPSFCFLWKGFTSAFLGEFQRELNSAVLKDMRSNKDNISVTVLAVDILRKESKYKWCSNSSVELLFTEWEEIRRAPSCRAVPHIWRCRQEICFKTEQGNLEKNECDTERSKSGEGLQPTKENKKLAAKRRITCNTWMVLRKKFDKGQNMRLYRGDLQKYSRLLKANPILRCCKRLWLTYGMGFFFV